MKSSRYSLRLILVLGIFAICATSATLASARTPSFAPAEEEPLSAKSQEQIRSLVNESAAASAKKNWEDAHSALLKAWDIKPLPMIAANLGYVEIKLGQYREAAEHLQFFLEKAPADHPERRADAEQQLAECRSHIAVVNVSTDVVGARVALNSLVIGLTPLRRPIFLDPGTHTIEVAHSGYQSDQRITTVQAGSDLDLEFKLVAEPVVASQPTPAVQTIPIAAYPVSAKHPGIQPRTWFLIGGSVVTAIGLGVGIGYRIRANSLGGEVSSTDAQLDSVTATTSGQKCVSPTGDAQSLCSQLKSTLRQQDTAVNVATGSFVAAGVLGVATAATYLLWPKKKTTPSQPEKVAFGVAPFTEGKTQGLLFYSAF
jgi:putative intracellular protease/amidase